jgi:tetratricopeptide (TPR) repeat protein
MCELLEQLASLRCYTLGPEHPDTLKAIADLAVNLWDCSCWNGRGSDITETMLQDVLQAQERMLGPAHADTHFSRVSLGSCYIDQGRFEEAKEVLQKAVQLSTEAFGAEHRDTKWACDMLRQCDEHEEEEERDEAWYIQQQQQQVSK